MNKTQTRRDFIRTLVGAAGLVAAGPLISGAATLEAKLDFLPEKRLGLNRKYDNIAHKFLDIEAEVDFGNAECNVVDSDYQILDHIIDVAQKRINRIRLDKPFTEYTDEEATRVLKTISRTFRCFGFRYQETTLLNKGLKDTNRKMDCDLYSAVYLGIADVMGLPLKAVNTPKHVFIRWHLYGDFYNNWETTIARELFDDYYISFFSIPRISIEKGVFLKSLSRKEFYPNAYNGIGIELGKYERYGEAIKMFDKALNLDPNYLAAHVNKGAAFHFLGRDEEAIETYNKALALCPNDPIVLNNKKIALSKLKEK